MSLPALAPASSYGGVKPFSSSLPGAPAAFQDVPYWLALVGTLTILPKVSILLYFRARAKANDYEIKGGLYEIGKKIKASKNTMNEASCNKSKTFHNDE